MSVILGRAIVFLLIMHVGETINGGCGKNLYLGQWLGNRNGKQCSVGEWVFVGDGSRGEGGA